MTPRFRPAHAALLTAAALATIAPASPTPAPAESGADCAVRTTGSTVTALCHNPHSRTDRLRLHVECARWWDVDTDGAPVDAAPARGVELTGRCWKEVASAWVSHRPA
ncbi:hypothetical protein [Streptomyces sp. NPDC002644]